LPALALTASANGCSTVKYLVQATEGQFALFNRARPIPEVIQDPRTPPRVRDLLDEVAPIKKFGEERGLKPTTNYTEYVKLDRPAAVWVVSASEPLEFKSRQWHFPVVGTFPYLGWFDLGDAKEYAQDLRKEGLDVDVRGARAYSTLGWFRDAVLSTMIPEGEEALGELVNVVIHESVHATVYIAGQAYFNESVASFVADRLTEVYLDSRPKATPAKPEEIASAATAFKVSAYDTRPAGGQSISLERIAYLKDEQDGQARQKKLHDAYEKLRALYESGKPNPEKLEEKKKILDSVKEELGFRRDLNNATLIQYKTYNTGGKEFESLWKACGTDSRRFMKAVGKLKNKSFQKEQQEDLGPVLLPLAQSGC
jgi:predicted aminopeptidase